MRLPTPTYSGPTMLQEARNPHAQVRALLDEIRRKLNDPGAVERASDEIEVLTSAYMLPPLNDGWIDYGLTTTEGKFFDLLFCRFGKIVTPMSLMNAAYPDADRAPADNIVKVYVTKIRKKLKAVGAPYHIETIWGTGYRLKDGELPGRKIRCHHTTGIVTELERDENGKAIRKAA